MIRVEALEKRYGELRAVDGVTFSVERGEVVGFLGPNGAGKSTTMRCLAGYLFPDAGTLAIGGRAVHPEDLETRRAVGYLPESTPLYRRMRVELYLDFVGRIRGLGRSERRAAIARVIGDCGLEGRARQRIGTLSKGYRQRVGLAQALLSDPDVLILDEPTGGLDPAEVTRMRELVRDLGERKTILLSTHVLSEVQETCRRVVILAGGKVVADGTPLDLAAGERAELRVTIEDAGDDAVTELGRVEGVAAARRTGVDDAGRRGVALEVDDRHACARRVGELARAKGWTLVELRHELPSLEQVFLRRTQPAAAVAEEERP
ncbi:MAG: ATP-binding cassette domain-containing protein [Planctomycetota bacterium]